MIIFADEQLYYNYYGYIKTLELLNANFASRPTGCLIIG